MWIIMTILTGLIVGVIAKILMPGPDAGGFILTSILGIAGAVVAGWLGSAMGYYQPGDGVGFLAAVIGAMLLLGIGRIFRRV